MGRYIRLFAFSMAAAMMIGGATPADATILVEIRTIGADVKAAEIQYEIDRVWVKSWSISGDADERPTEEVAFHYNKMHPVWEPTGDGRK
jgi:hypothetical protein